jgi:hypothetical protein
MFSNIKPYTAAEALVYFCAALVVLFLTGSF